jgi:hypothetical protein
MITLVLPRTLTLFTCTFVSPNDLVFCANINVLAKLNKHTALKALFIALSPSLS